MWPNKLETRKHSLKVSQRTDKQGIVGIMTLLQNISKVISSKSCCLKTHTHNWPIAPNGPLNRLVTNHIRWYMKQARSVFTGQTWLVLIHNTTYFKHQQNSTALASCHSTLKSHCIIMGNQQVHRRDFPAWHHTGFPKFTFTFTSIHITHKISFQEYVPDHFQNFINFSPVHDLPSSQISQKFTHNFLS